MPALRLSLGVSVSKAVGRPPVNVTPPAISGAEQVGQTLTANPGTWIGEVTLSWQWQRYTGAWDGIVAATGETYDLAGEDEGASVRVKQSAANEYGSTAAYSNETGIISGGGGGSGVAEVTELDWVGANAANIRGAGFEISTATDRFGVWFYLDGDTQPVLDNATTYLQVNLNELDEGTGIAAAVESVLGSYFSIINNGSSLTVTDLDTGPRADASAPYGGTNIIIVTQGEDPT